MRTVQYCAYDCTVHRARLADRPIASPTGVAIADRQSISQSHARIIISWLTIFLNVSGAADHFFDTTVLNAKIYLSNCDMSISYIFFSHISQLTYRKDYIPGPAYAREVSRTHTESVMASWSPHGFKISHAELFFQLEERLCKWTGVEVYHKHIPTV